MEYDLHIAVAQKSLNFAGPVLADLAKIGSNGQTCAIFSNYASLLENWGPTLYLVTNIKYLEFNYCVINWEYGLTNPYPT